MVDDMRAPTRRKFRKEALEQGPRAEAISQLIHGDVMARGGRSLLCAPEFLQLLRFLALSVTIAPALSQLNSGCFNNAGATTGDCSAFVTLFCDSIAQSSITNTASQCFNTPSGSFKCDLTALNQASTAGFANANDCIIALLTLSENCPEGGEGIFAGKTMLYVVDANNGTCGLPCGT
ncbi:hypothetical protein C8R44DRAFT_744681 [Mycena epipterygia]|nr:hypothetical protein C8R44DRAFT_744681 [Mycena epipterygia]